jgi:hypothetical protein
MQQAQIVTKRPHPHPPLMLLIPLHSHHRKSTTMIWGKVGRGVMNVFFNANLYKQCGICNVFQVILHAIEGKQDYQTYAEIPLKKSLPFFAKWSKPQVTIRPAINQNNSILQTGRMVI